MTGDTKRKKKTFREAFAQFVAKQYLPFSIIQEKSLQDSYLAFLEEFGSMNIEPMFVTDKTVAADILKMADQYVVVISKRFTSRHVNPLEYWRANKVRFPILAAMARDYLALQPTSKDVEGTFSKGRRTIPYYRISQNASTIRNQMLVNSGYNLDVFQ